MSYINELKMSKNEGNNYFRTLFFGESYEIEFEHLNNYNDRLNTAWEFDKLIEFCEKEKMYCYFNLQNHECVQDIGDFTQQYDWTRPDQMKEFDCSAHPKIDVGYCYNTELGLPSPQDFFTDEKARKHYKNRLRYITSRWGYSTAISAFELRSEMNNSAKEKEISYDPTTRKCVTTLRIDHYLQNTDRLLSKISAWQDEMCGFLKHDQYMPHPTAVCYTGNPIAFWDGKTIQSVNCIEKGDSSYLSPNVDIATYNYYDAKISKYELIHKTVNLLRDKKGVSHLTKPIMISEIGEAVFQFCSQDVGFHKDAWITSFTGLATPAMTWHFQHRFEINKTLKLIEGFVADSALGDLNEDHFCNHYLRDDLLAETFYWSSKGKNRYAMGVVDNRTVNWWTLGDADSYCTKHEPEKDIYKTAQALSASKKDKLKVDMGKGGKYNVVFYHTRTGKVIGTEQQKARFGKINLAFPTLGVDGESATVAFKITPAKLKKEKANPIVEPALQLNSFVETLPKATFPSTKW